MSWYWTVLSKYSRFRGRARRKEYWYFTLCHLLIILGLAVVDSLLFGELQSNTREAPLLLTGIYALATMIPAIAVSVRRLHDIGRSGWWYLISLVPFGSLVLLVFTLQDSEPQSNQYGSNPKRFEFIK